MKKRVGKNEEDERMWQLHTVSFMYHCGIVIEMEMIDCIIN